MTNPAPTCPHCGARLRKWRVPEGASWSEEFFYVCFDDACRYFQEGWVWMKEQFAQHASFRYALNASTGASLPLPVWSDSATREMIVDEEDEGETP
jgi:hypothetical protein